MQFRLPDLGEGLTEGEVARWLVREGDEVAEDDPLVEVQTDKATVEIPSPAAGRVSRILVSEGEVVPVGTALVVIGDDDAGGGDRGVRAERPRSVKELVLAESAPGPMRRRGGARATPLVRRLAKELGVDLESIAGTGPQGRVTEEDVRRAAGAGEALSGGQSLERKAHGTVTEGRRRQLRGTRRVIAEHMARAHREVPPVTWVEECDFDRIDLGVLVAHVVRSCALALREYPELNARLEGNEIVELDRYDVGVAVQTDDGLVVPVVRGCEAKSVEEIDADVRRLAEAARAGALAPDELRGSTFTVTSAGKLAGLLQTPIVNYPEVAILSVGRIAPRPVVRDDEIVVRRIGLIAITFDHRVVDGTRVAEFGLAVIRRLEDPALLTG